VKVSRFLRLSRDGFKQNFGAEEKRSLAGKGVFRYRALLGVCDLCYSASLLQGPFLGDGRACSTSAESDIGTESLLA